MNEHHLQRSLLIRAERSTVFRYFTDSTRFAAWWGKGSSIDGKEGGVVRIVYPDGSVASGSILELEPQKRVVFSYGYEDESKPIAPGESVVTITLEEHPLGTLLHLDHAFGDAATRDVHVPGWRFQLALFTNVVAKEQHAGLDDLLDRYFRAYSEADECARAATLKALVTPDVHFKDAYACVEGIEDFLGHITAALAHGVMGIIERDGPARQCQGTAVADWSMRDSEGNVILRGSNVLELAADGRLARICGLWSPPGA